MARILPEPSYISLSASGELEHRAAISAELLKDCTLCPRQCHVDRTLKEEGFCRTSACARISGFGPHFGEEPELVGRGGSGTIFFTGCNLACVYCQNHEISQGSPGRRYDASALAGMMLSLQERGCHNINFVTPSHVVPQILGALVLAAKRGLSVPLVYNSGGYDSVATLRLIDGVFDIYMPDAKYGSNTVAEALSHVSDYVPVMKEALIEMHRQVGDLIVSNGIAARGMIIRHLVLPGNLAGTREVMEFIACCISPDSYVNIMPQYMPLWHAADVAQKDPAYCNLNRPIMTREYFEALQIARRAGLHRGW